MPTVQKHARLKKGDKVQLPLLILLIYYWTKIHINAKCEKLLQSVVSHKSCRLLDVSTFAVDYGLVVLTIPWTNLQTILLRLLR